MSTLSPAAIESNRRNARKSTGPRTPQGKAIAAQNALRHGLFAKDLLLSGESADELLELKTSTLTRLNPRDAFELELVERVVTACWKLRRLQRVERALYQQTGQRFAQRDGYGLREAHGLDHRQPVPAEVVWQYGGESFQQELQRIETGQHRLENALHRCLRQLEKLRQQEIEATTPFAEQTLTKERDQHEKWRNQAGDAQDLERAAQRVRAREKNPVHRVRTELSALRLTTPAERSPQPTCSLTQEQGCTQRPPDVN